MVANQTYWLLNMNSIGHTHPVLAFTSRGFISVLISRSGSRRAGSIPFVQEAEVEAFKKYLSHFQPTALGGAGAQFFWG